MRINPNINREGQTSKILKPFKKIKEKAKNALEAIDRYTKPREATAGNFEKASYFQACFTGATEGFYVMGPPGIVVGSLSGAVGVMTTNLTGKTFIGVASGVTMGIAIGAALGAIGGPASLLTGAIGGGLLGAMETFRGNPDSKTRDGGGNANMISAMFVPGPAKMAGGIGSAVGTRMKSDTAKAVVGGLTAATIGGVLAAVGFAPVSIPVAAAGCAAAGVLGPFLGPRFSQLFRNLSNDLGNLIEKGGKKLGLIKEDGSMNVKAKNVIGAIPSSFIKEGLRGFALSDGNIGKMLLGGVMESFEQAHIFLTQKYGHKGEKAKNTPPNNK